MQISRARPVEAAGATPCDPLTTRVLMRLPLGLAGPILIACGAIACATPRAPAPPAPGDQLDHALELLRAARYPDAKQALAELAASDPTTPEGRLALLAMAAIEIDPRNPDRHPEVGASLAAAHLRHAPDDPLTTTVAEVLGLVARELDAVARAVNAHKASGDDLPTGIALELEDSTLPPLPATRILISIRDLSRERAHLTGRVRELEVELDRIRRVLSP